MDFKLFFLQFCHLIYRYKETSSLPALWLKESLNAFRESLLNLSRPSRQATHASLERVTVKTPVLLNASTLKDMHADVVNCKENTNSNLYGSGRNGNEKLVSTPNGYCDKNVQQQTVFDNLSKLMSSCVILRLADFQLYRITTSGRKQMPKEFISG